MNIKKIAYLALLALTPVVSFSAALPDPGMSIDPERTAIVITDPQVDFLSPKGVTWGVIGKSVTDNNTVENIETLFKLGDKYNIPTFISPHYYFPSDSQWKFEGALEVLMHKIHIFDRDGQLSLKNFQNSGADWMPIYKPYIAKSNVVVTSPHKLYGPESNDLVLQLRKRGIDKVILGGMSANLCTESHMRELIEQGFEVVVVKDATAGAATEQGDGYDTAVINFRFIASDVWTTKEAADSIDKAYSGSM